MACQRKQNLKMIPFVSQMHMVIEIHLAERIYAFCKTKTMNLSKMKKNHELRDLKNKFY